LRDRPRVFGAQTELNAACAVASRLAGRTIIPGGPNKHVRDEHLTVFIVHTASGLVVARLGVADNLVNIQYATDIVQDTSLTPSFAESIEVNNFGLCLHGPNPGAEYVVNQTRLHYNNNGSRSDILDIGDRSRRSRVDIAPTAGLLHLIHGHSAGNFNPSMGWVDQYTRATPLGRRALLLTKA